MKQKILFISHCFLNDGAKLKHQDMQSRTDERNMKRHFLKQMLDHDIELIQLACPEFILYGTNRWGHASSQFDTPFFRKEAAKLLEPFLLQLEEYAAYPDRFEILGVIGIDGSPSCGVNFTYDGDWGGEFSGNPNLNATLATLKQEAKPGIFMEVFQQLLKEKGLSIPFYSMENFPLYHWE